MTLEEINTASPEELEKRLRPCLDVSRWVETMISLRPFSSQQQCLEAAENAAAPLTTEEIEAALAHHPRIGERKDGDSAEATLSRSEQAGLGDASATTEEKLAAGNRAYEEKFGRVFLIRAAGRSHAEILSELERRMEQDPEREREEVGEQLLQIAARRLEGLL